MRHIDLILYSTLLALGLMGCGILSDTNDDGRPQPFFIDFPESQLTEAQEARLLQSLSEPWNARARTVRVRDMSELTESESIYLNLFPEVEFEAVRDSVFWQLDAWAWIGRPVDKDDEGGYVIFSYIDKDLYGTIWFLGKHYRIRSLAQGSGVHAIYEQGPYQWPPD